MATVATTPKAQIAANRIVQALASCCSSLFARTEMIDTLCADVTNRMRVLEIYQ
jgi:hypothetical protein